VHVCLLVPLSVGRVCWCVWLLGFWLYYLGGSIGADIVGAFVRAIYALCAWCVTLNISRRVRVYTWFYVFCSCLRVLAPHVCERMYVHMYVLVMQMAP